MARFPVDQAFARVCRAAKKAGNWYVSLVESVPYYGGPEEGGWWGRDTHVVAYQIFHSAEEAEKAKAKVELLATKLSAESKSEFGETCLQEMEWLDERGLEPDYLGEVDGESEFFVVVTEGEYQESRGCRHYS